VNTSRHTTVPRPAATVVGGEDDIVYRTVSVPAVLSLLLGLASPLSFIAPLLLVIPLAGAVLALLALRRIAESDGAMIGRGAALVTLALCVASSSATFSRSVVEERLLSRQARQVALEWFELLQRGDVERAFALTLDSIRPSAPPDPTSSVAEAEQNPLERFRGHSVVRYMVIGNGAIEVRYERDLGFDPGLRGQCRIEQQYRVGAFQPTSPAPPATIRVTLQRILSGDAPPRWLVAGTLSDDVPNAGAD